jgi:molecular chaperone GrpE (heat shock protein)
MLSMKTYLRLKKISKELKMRVLKYLQYLQNMQQQNIIDEKTIMENLSQNLKLDLIKYVDNSFFFLI